MSKTRLVKTTGRATASGTAKTRLVKTVGRSLQGAIATSVQVLDPFGVAEAFETVRFTCDSTGAVTSWTFTFPAGSYGGTLGLTTVGVDNNTTGVTVRSFQAPYSDLAGGTVTINAIAHTIAGDQAGTIVVPVYPPVDRIRRAGAWVARPALTILHRP